MTRRVVSDIERLPNAARVLDADDGIPYLSHRDDPFSCVSGADLLVGDKIEDSSPTQRFVASCCNSGKAFEQSTPAGRELSEPAKAADSCCCGGGGKK